MYEFEPLSESHFPAVVRLFWRVVGQRVTVDFLKKKYHAPFPDSEMHGFVAVEKSSGEVVSLAGALRFEVVFEGKKWAAAQTMDNFTLSAHTGRGLMTELLRRVVERLEGRGVQLFFGFCNQNNAAIYLRKLGWDLHFNMICFEKTVATFPLEAVLRQLGLARFYEKWARQVLKKNRLAERVFPNSLNGEGWASIQRDRSFFQYKRFNFNEIVEISGAKIWLKPAHGLLVGDCEVASDFDFFWLELNRLARRLGVRKIIFQVSPETELLAQLSSRLKQIDSWAIVVRSLDAGFPIDRLRFGYGDFDTF